MQAHTHTYIHTGRGGEDVFKGQEQNKKVTHLGKGKVGKERAR